MTNFCKKIAKTKAKVNKVKKDNNNVGKALCDYIDYFVERGAKEIHIDTDEKSRSLSIWTDITLSEEQMKSTEFQSLANNLYSSLIA